MSEGWGQKFESKPSSLNVSEHISDEINLFAKFRGLEDVEKAHCTSELVVLHFYWYRLFI